MREEYSSHIFILILLWDYILITRRIPNVDIVTRKFIMRRNVEPKKMT